MASVAPGVRALVLTALTAAASMAALGPLAARADGPEGIGRDAVIGGTPVTRRVIGGSASSPGAWPSVVALVGDGFGTPADRQFCGGTVIASRWVLTAAHCRYVVRDGRPLEPFEMRVVAGVSDLRAEEPDEETVVTAIYEHPLYDNNSAATLHDIALLELATALEVPAVAPFRGEVASLGAASATVVGWGATRYTGTGRDGRASGYPDALHEATLPLVSREVCNAPESYDGLIGEGQLCAGFARGGVDSCVGDSGGPLFIDRGEGLEQVGVVSFGSDCAAPLFYGIYTDVSFFLDWIAQYVELPGGAERPREATSGGEQVPIGGVSSSVGGGGGAPGALLLGALAWAGRRRRRRGGSDRRDGGVRVPRSGAIVRRG